MALSEFMNVLRRAAKRRLIVSIDYFSDTTGEETFGRLVEPYELKNGFFWAYDIAKGGIRKFNENNVLNLVVTKQRFSPRWPVKI